MRQQLAVGPLPPGSVLLHIGPQKTGTTAIQAAFHRARRDLLQQGVRYAGPNRQSKQAARALTGAGGSQMELTRHARRLVREVQGRGTQRVVVSAEAFADADDAAIPHVIEALGGGRVHVAVTLRPLARILPSQWQQFVQGGHGDSFDGWIAKVLDGAPRDGNAATGNGLTRRFWRRHRHDQLITRWAAVVGRDRVTAIALDDANRNGSVRAFEQLVGLREGTLVIRDESGNRSLTHPEAELLRELNHWFASEGIDRQVRAGLMPNGVAEYLKARQPGASEPRIVTPDWALDRIEEVAADIVARIRTLGIRVIGDLDVLAAAPEPAEKRRPSPQRGTDGAAWATLAAAASFGVLVAGGFARSGPVGNASAARGEPFPWPDDFEPLAPSTPDLSMVSTPRVASVIAGRVRSLRARLPAVPAPPIHSAGVEEQ